MLGPLARILGMIDKTHTEIHAEDHLHTIATLLATT